MPWLYRPHCFLSTKSFFLANARKQSSPLILLISFDINHDGLLKFALKFFSHHSQLSIASLELSRISSGQKRLQEYPWQRLSIPTWSSLAQTRAEERVVIAKSMLSRNAAEFGRVAMAASRRWFGIVGPMQKSLAKLGFAEEQDTITKDRASEKMLHKGSFI